MTSMTNPDALVEELAEALFNAQNTTPVSWRDLGYESRKERFSVLVRAILPIIEAHEAAAKEQAERLAEALEVFALIADMNSSRKAATSVRVNVDRLREARAALAAWEKSRG